MDKIVEGFLRRNLPDYVNKFNVTLIDSDNEKFTLTAKHLKYKFGKNSVNLSFYGVKDMKNMFIPVIKTLYHWQKNYLKFIKIGRGNL